MHRTGARRPTLIRLSPLRIALVYLVISVLWIVLSDRLDRMLAPSRHGPGLFQTVKGITFVSLTALAIFWLVRWGQRQAVAAAKRADETDLRYRSLVETSPDGIAVQTGGVIRFANDSLARLLGYERGDELVGRVVADFASPNELDVIGERIRRINEERTPLPPLMERFLRRDGREVAVEVAARPIEYEGAAGAMVIIRDVEPRLAAERALRESDERFRRMASNIPGAIFRYVLNTDGVDRLEYMSPGCRAIWEHDVETLMGNVGLLWDAIHPDDVEPMRVSVNESARTGRPWSMTWRIRTPSGRSKWLQGYGQPTRADSGDVIWDSVIFDITERKRAEDATLAAEKRLSHILQSMNDGFLLLDEDLRFLAANDSALRLLERTPGEILGKHAFEVFPYLKHSAWHDMFGQVRKDREPRTSEGRFEPLDKWFEARIEATDDGLAVFFRDITERRRAEQRQQLMMRELDHRVKNNLAAVLAIAENSLREAHSLVDFSDSFVGRIRAMASMHSLLAARRWEGVGLVPLMQTIVAPYADARDGKRVEFSGPDLILPSTAAPAVCMTVHELATNAAKHGALSGERGRVRVSWEIDPLTEDLRIAWSERGGPPIASTVDPGFGLDLLQGVIPYELNGDVRLRFTEEGLDASIFIPGDTLRRAHADDLATPSKGR